jgi:hypothetical protein
MTQVKGINKLVEMILKPKPMFSELHMCISTTNVSSVIVRSKNLEILNIMNVKILHPTPNPPKTAKKNEFFME